MQEEISRNQSFAMNCRDDIPDAASRRETCQEYSTAAMGSWLVMFSAYFIPYLYSSFSSLSFEKLYITRMHSSRMRTGRSLTVCPGGVSPCQGGFSLPGKGVSLPGGLPAREGSPCWRGVLPAGEGGSPCPGGVLPAGGGGFSLPRGLHARGGVLPAGGGGDSPCPGGSPCWGGGLFSLPRGVSQLRQTPPPCEQNE